MIGVTMYIRQTDFSLEKDWIWENRPSMQFCCYEKYQFEKFTLAIVSSKCTKLVLEIKHVFSFKKRGIIIAVVCPA